MCYAIGTNITLEIRWRPCTRKIRVPASKLSIVLFFVNTIKKITQTCKYVLLSLAHCDTMFKGTYWIFIQMMKMHKAEQNQTFNFPKSLNWFVEG